MAGGAPSPTSVARGARVPSAHRRPGYPSSGCVPAVPDSVSPGGPTVTSTLAWSKSKGLGRADNARLARCTPEPWWVPFARRCGPLLLADYQGVPGAVRGVCQALGHGGAALA